MNGAVWNATLFNNSWNGSLHSEIAPRALTISLIIISSWIIITNGLVFLCLVLNRHALKKFVNLQILSLSVTDTLVGLTLFPMIMTYQNNTFLRPFWTCAVVLYSCMVSQLATILHALSICICRLIIIKRRGGNSETNPRGMYKKLFLQVSLPWIGSLVSVGALFIFYTKHNRVVAVCSLNELFEDNYIPVIVIPGVISILSHITTNGVYVYVLIFLLRKWKRVGAIRNVSILAATTPRNRTTTHGNETKFESKKNKHTGLKRNPGTFKNKTTPSVPLRLTVFNKTSSADREQTQASTSFNDPHQETSSETRVTKNMVKLGVKEQKDVIITIGLLLLVLNLFMTPVLVVPIADALTEEPLSRLAKFILVVFPLINSVINPFIYFFRIKQFRNVLRHTWDKAYSCFRL